MNNIKLYKELFKLSLIGVLTVLFMLLISVVCTNSVSLSFEVKTQSSQRVDFQIFYTDLFVTKEYNEMSSVSDSQVIYHNDWQKVSIKIPIQHFNVLKKLRLDIDRVPINDALYIRNLTLEKSTLNLGMENIKLNDLLIYPENSHEFKIVPTAIDPYISIEGLPSQLTPLIFKMIAALFIIVCLWGGCEQWGNKAACYSFLHRNRMLILFIALIISFYLLNWLTYKDIALHLLYVGKTNEALYKIIYVFTPELLLLLLGCYLVVRVRKLRYILTSIVLFITLFRIVDSFIFIQFSTHLGLDDVRNFGKDAFKSLPIIFDFIKSQKLIFLLSLVLIVLILSVCIFKFSFETNRDKKIISTVLVGVFLIYIILPRPSETLWEGHIVNIFQLSNDNTKVPYSKKYQDDLKNYFPNVIKTVGLNSRKNVILLVIESLSSDESALFGSGRHNNTPNLDRIASQNIAFLNHYSNGYNTDAGNFALLTGLPYIHGWNGGDYEKVSPYALPSLLKSKGYETNIMYSAEPIGLLDYIWKAAGFQHFYDGHDKEYESRERLVFNSVADEYLLENLYKKMQSWSGLQFTMVMTTTTHSPYILPETNKKDFHGTIRYIDKVINDFYLKLKADGFFNNGILVITGDHRAMVPFTNDERQRYGEIGIARVPLVIVGDNITPSFIKTPTSHISIGAIIQYLVLDEVSLFDFQSIPLTNDPMVNGPTPIFYQRHTPRDEVLIAYVLNEKQIVNKIKLNGDETSFEVSDEYSSSKRDLLKLIYWLRKDWSDNMALK